jgi:hypothetical protein
MCKKCNGTHQNRDSSPEKLIGAKQIAGSTALAIKVNIGTPQRPDLVWLPRSVVRIDDAHGIFVKQWYIVRHGLTARITPEPRTTNGT